MRRVNGLRLKDNVKSLLFLQEPEIQKVKYERTTVKQCAINFHKILTESFMIHCGCKDSCWFAVNLRGVKI